MTRHKFIQRLFALARQFGVEDLETYELYAAHAAYNVGCMNPRELARQFGWCK